MSTQAITQRAAETYSTVNPNTQQEPVSSATGSIPTSSIQPAQTEGSCTTCWNSITDGLRTAWNAVYNIAVKIIYTISWGTLCGDANPPTSTTRSSQPAPGSSSQPAPVSSSQTVPAPSSQPAPVSSPQTVPVSSQPALGSSSQPAPAPLSQNAPESSSQPAPAPSSQPAPESSSQLVPTLEQRLTQFVQDITANQTVSHSCLRAMDGLVNETGAEDIVGPEITRGLAALPEMVSNTIYARVAVVSGEGDGAAYALANPTSLEVQDAVHFVLAKHRTTQFEEKSLQAMDTSKTWQERVRHVLQLAKLGRDYTQIHISDQLYNIIGEEDVSMEVIQDGILNVLNAMQIADGEIEDQFLNRLMESGFLGLLLRDAAWQFVRNPENRSFLTGLEFHACLEEVIREMPHP